MSHNLASLKTDFSAWYNAAIKAADFAEHSAVRGAMVLKPDGCDLWEHMRVHLDGAFKDVGVRNAYFPLFFPVSYLSKEAEHVEGFSKECAVVTHHRLCPGKAGLVPDETARLTEPLVVRPTSETIIWDCYKRWIQSYRDLPLKINQWANIVRWEMRTRLFLRTSEILWQEGHNAFATGKEAQEDAEKMWNLYADFMRNTLAIPVIQGRKTASERFAGAKETYTVEALMQDGKALQLGTAHNLGTNFGDAFGVSFVDRSGQIKSVHGTSWGVSTRMIGGLIMVHGDQKGVVLPPAIAPIQVIILPVLKQKSTDQDGVITAAQQLQDQLLQQGIRTQIDLDTQRSMGTKFYAYERKGIPLRLTLGAREIAAGQVQMTRRDNGATEQLPIVSCAIAIQQILTEIQQSMLHKATTQQAAKTFRVDNFDAFKQQLKTQKGFLSAHWDGSAESEKKIQELTQATIRCIPKDAPEEAGYCIYSGKPSKRRVLFAQAY